MLCSCQTADEKQIAPGDPIRHDDFVYTARRVVTQDSIGSLKPAGRFWIVTFKVENQAKHVTHAWTNHIAYLTDSAGHVYENQLKAQQQLNRLQPFGWHDSYLSPAGRLDSTQFVFDLPTSVQKPYLQVRGEVLMGDVLDGRQFEKVRVRLF